MINEEVDVLKLYAGLLPGFEDAKAWNVWLTKCLNTDNLNGLLKARKGIQIGMASAQRRGLTNEKLIILFCRWTQSIDSTIRKVIKKREGKMNKKDKKKLDADVERFLRKSAY